MVVSNLTDLIAVRTFPEDPLIVEHFAVIAALVMPWQLPSRAPAGWDRPRLAWPAVIVVHSCAVVEIGRSCGLYVRG